MNKDTFEKACKLQQALNEINDNEPWGKLFQNIQSIEYAEDGWVHVIDQQLSRGYAYIEHYIIPYEALTETVDIEKYNH